jgi:hypothetical protein
MSNGRAFSVDTWAVLWFNIRIIDLAASYAYADSIYDLPLLEAVGHPVAVSPEERLASIARQRGLAHPRPSARETPGSTKWGTGAQ